MDSNQKSNSRRRILKGVVAGSAVASIPAKSVWAATTTTSVGASGGSGNLQTQCIALRSPGYYKNNADSAGWFTSTSKFIDIFGGALLGTTGPGTKLDDLKDITLMQVLVHSNAGQGGELSWKGNSKDLGGPNNINRFLVAMYANAYVSGNSGVWYPVVSNNGNGGAYASAEDFAMSIYQDAQYDEYNMATEMDRLIQEYPANDYLPDCAN